jgi:hypothetical protein
MGGIRQASAFTQEYQAGMGIAKLIIITCKNKIAIKLLASRFGKEAGLKLDFFFSCKSLKAKLIPRNDQAPTVSVVANDQTIK